MSKTGILVVNNRRSSIDGTSLAYQEDGMDPYAAATNFMTNHGCRKGDCVTVEGTQNGNDFWLDDAQKNSPDVCGGSNAEAPMAATAALVRRPATAGVTPAKAVKAAAARAPAKAVKKAAKKAPAKKTLTKAATKKATKKKGKNP